ncbi:hypothetical protein LG200_06695 [Methylobacillus caricis]|uniref:hypothetical protein n=1 Tax=Methylobacillus caricis TaxID=1971611 RepID=UPI001CFF559C|nr:hypothetical protein [Methylobacillus caricis]MCB5187693.1 hypothetical protein [Methylobacillus caricis]
MPAQYLISLYYFFSPRKKSFQTLKGYLLNDYSSGDIRFYFSGRVAIYKVADYLIKTSRVALLPDYICNVVYKAFEAAGFEIVTYATSDVYEPDWGEVSRLGQENTGAVLLLASIYGSEFGRNWILSQNGYHWREENKISVVFDLCQDITQINSLSSHEYIGSNYAIVGSFNDKSFPGVMGGVVVTDIPDEEYAAPSFLDCCRVLSLFVQKLLKLDRMRAIARFFLVSVLSSKPKIKNIYDYSYCNYFPYDFQHSGATKLQIAMAAAGVNFLEKYSDRKKEYLLLNRIKPLKTPYYLTAPFVMVQPDDPGINKDKPPYAVNRNPFVSLKSEIKVKHFKGFDDI